MTEPALVARYGLFAIAATAVNLGTQHACLALFDRPPLGLPLAMALGTLAGLLAKYVLDKRWIFADPASGLCAHSRKLALYTLMGVATTAVFWGTELAFARLFGSGLMRDVGAVLGLGLGYGTKYHLDRRFVFQPAPLP